MTNDEGPMTGSGGVIRVELHVLVGEVAGVERAAPASEGEPQFEVYLAVVLQVRGRGGRVERERSAGPVQRQVAHPEGEVFFVELNARVPRGRYHAAPVRVRA